MMFKKIVFLFLSLMLMMNVSSTVLGHSDSPTLLEDVNKDGVVNIQDLVLVANALGQMRDHNAQHDPDVNRDGIINILDLVRVSNRFGETVPDEHSSYHAIQEYVFDRSCANSACHAAPTNIAGLNLTYANSYEEIVGEVPENPNAAAAGMKLVDPGNPENSFLLTKLISPIAREHGARMPLGSGVLHDGKIDAIRKWIAAGAPQTGKVEAVGDLGVLRDPEEVFVPPAPPPPGQGYQLHLPPFRIDPGTEREVFYETQIRDENGNLIEDDIFINRYEIFYPTGSHHFILYRLTDAAITEGILDAGVTQGIGVDPNHVFRELDPDDAQALGNLGTHRFFVAGTQSDDFSFQFPEGVALRLPGDTLFDLNSHYINLLGTETLIGETYINIYTLPPEEVKYEAIEIFVSNTEINVPPGRTRVTKMDWYVEDELLLRDAPSDAVMNIIMLTSHMHRHGELFEIKQMSTSELLHRSIIYDDAPITFYNPPLMLDATDGLSFQCTHNNYDLDGPIEFGFTSEDEMCLIVGYYYLSTVADTNEN
ncbi:hypothetical protein C6497_10855 [Candidatus Poribacteria bacterium]|nr:MAG: hypothetical protein C6497_10855 [Candidatus Poribacteria bacterium]